MTVLGLGLAESKCVGAYPGNGSKHPSEHPRAGNFVPPSLFP